MVILFVIVFALVIGGGWLWVKHLRKETLNERARLANIAEGDKPGNTVIGLPDQQTNGKIEPAPVRMVISQAEADALAAILRRQMIELLEKYNPASQEIKIWHLVANELVNARHDATREKRYPRGSDREAAKAYVSERQARYVRYIQAKAAMAELDGKQMPAATSAEAALGAITQSLRRVDKLSAQEMPASLAPVVAAARHRRDSLKNSVAELKEQAKQCVKESSKYSKPRAKVTSLSALELDGLLKCLVDSAVEAVVAYQDMSHPTSEAIEAFCRWDGLKSERFTEPQKPTAEEVGRYLQEIEQWAQKYLEAERTAALSLTALQVSISACQKKTDALAQALNKLSGVKGKDVEQVLEASMSLAEDLLEILKEALQNRKQQANEWSARVLKSSPCVPTATVAETGEITTLRGLARTIGFALAQLNVARAKLEQAQNKRVPSYARTPSWSTPDVDQYIEGFRQWVEQAADIDKQRAQLAAEVAVAQNAGDARQAKVYSSADALSIKATASEKTLGDGSADELCVVVIASQKLCQLHTKR